MGILEMADTELTDVCPEGLPQNIQGRMFTLKQNPVDL